MRYRAVENRCAVHIHALQLPIPPTSAEHILTRLGFEQKTGDVVAIARSQIGQSAYRLGARTQEAPDAVDCSSFVKWVYGQVGIWLPRRTIQQLQVGEPVHPDDLQAGDLLFKTGRHNWYIDRPELGVGHVGIATGSDTVIHAANRKRGVIESPAVTFLGEKFRGVRRLISHNEEIVTLIAPRHIDIETDDDIRWIILREL